jgi:tetratricopeptide (TPR) repeat protein
MDPTRAGLEHLARKEPDRAERAFREALLADPANLEAREGLARALLALGRHPEALAELNAVLGRDARRGSAERIRSEVLMAQGRYDEAVFHLKRAMELDSPDGA